MSVCVSMRRSLKANNPGINVSEKLKSDTVSRSSLRPGLYEDVYISWEVNVAMVYSTFCLSYVFILMHSK